jgi:hypothetical protein
MAARIKPDSEPPQEAITAATAAAMAAHPMAAAPDTRSGTD